MYVITSLYPTVRVGNSGMAFNLTFLNTVSDEEKSSKVQMQNSTCKNSSRIFFFFFNAKTEFFVSAHRSTSCHNSLTSDRLARTCLLGPRVFVYSWRTSTYDLSKTRRNGTANEDSTLFFSREISKMRTPNSWKSGITYVSFKLFQTNGLQYLYGQFENVEGGFLQHW